MARWVKLILLCVVVLFAVFNLNHNSLNDALGTTDWVNELTLAQLWPSQNDTTTTEEPDQEINLNRTAVVLTALGVLSSCAATRLKHLVETSGDTVDVWLLHGHHILANKGQHKVVQQSRQRIQNIGPGLFQWPQHHKPYLPFDGNSGSSKSSFLQFLAEHSDYEFAWHVENDMFYTGPWEDIFQSEMEREEDFLTTRIYNQTGTNWYWFKDCKVLSKKCTEVGSQAQVQAHWMFTRVSRRLATSLIQDVVDKLVKGHHEAIVGAYCHLRNFTIGVIDQTKVAQNIRAGHTGSATTPHNVSYFDPLPGTLIHPVKCTPTMNIQADIDKWTTRP